jgi:hypothetical protein
MKASIRILWWATYIAGALIVQQNIPGVDALVPGFLLSLQERKTWQSVWLFCIFVLIQEGAGSLTFGSAVLWYSGQVWLFHVSQRFFVAENILFVFMLSAVLGTYHFLLTWLMCSVQNLPLEFALLARESMIQAAIIPLIWGLAYFIRPKAAFNG